jgi:gas vesicle protein
MDGGKKFLMFALGTTAGAVVALLTAPGSGKETRRRLGSALQKAKEMTSSMSDSVIESVGRGTDALKDTFGMEGSRSTAASKASRTGYGSTPK